MSWTKSKISLNLAINPPRKMRETSWQDYAFDTIVIIIITFVITFIYAFVNDIVDAKSTLVMLILVSATAMMLTACHKISLLFNVFS